MAAVSIPRGLTAIHVYVPLSLVVILSMIYSARNTALLLVCSTLMILVDGTLTPSLPQSTPPGGEPRVVQLKVREEPTATVTVDGDGMSTTGGAICREI